MRKHLTLPLNDTRRGFLELRDYPKLGECRCVPLLDRKKQNSARALVEVIIASKAMRIFSATGSVHLASVGSGSFLSEVFLLMLLIRQGIKNISIDFIDAMYRDDARFEGKTFLPSKADAVEQLLQLLHHQLCLDVSLEKNPMERNPCQHMVSTSEKVLDRFPTYNQSDASVKIGFFGTVADYANHLKSANTNYLNIVLSMDFESVGYEFRTHREYYLAQQLDKQKLFNPLRELLPRTTEWADLEKNIDGLNIHISCQ